MPAFGPRFDLQQHLLFGCHTGGSVTYKLLKFIFTDKTLNRGPESIAQVVPARKTKHFFFIKVPNLITHGVRACETKHFPFGNVNQMDQNSHFSNLLCLTYQSSKGRKPWKLKDHCISN